MARTTVATVVDRIHRQINANQRNEVAELGIAIDELSGTINLGVDDLPESMNRGDILSIDGELMRVLTVDTTSGTLQVRRGWQDTAAVPHDSQARVWINPRFTLADIFEALVDEIDSWGPNLYRVAALTFGVPASVQTFALPAEWAGSYGIVSARRNWTGGVTDAWPTAQIKLFRTVDLAAAPGSGLLVRVWDDHLGQPGGSVHVTVALPFDVDGITWDTDLVGDVGLQRSMVDLAAYGVRNRLRVDSEDARSARDTQDDPRNAQEVPVGAAVTGQRAAWEFYQRRFKQEQNKLRAMYPIMVQA